MAMLRYDEVTMVAALARGPLPLRTAFAAACAERLLPAYEEYCRQTGRGDPTVLAGILDRVWAALLGAEMSAEQIRGEIDRCMPLIPEEDDEPWVDEQAYADDAASAVAYTLRALETGKTQEAAWAARRAYEAVDHHVTHRLAVEGDEHVLAHPVVQGELARQRRDLDELVDGTAVATDLIARLRDRARAEASIVFVSAT